MSHRFCLTAAAALLAASPALAGGFSAPVVTPPVAPPPVVPIVMAPSADWSGAYVGGQLGFGRFTSGGSFEDEGGEEVDFEDFEGNGALFGVHAGYMFDFGSVVLGAELDYDRTQIDIDGTDTLEEFFGPADGVGQIDSIARAKLRVGFDAGRFLPYVTAGLARMTMDFDNEFEDEFLGDFEDTYSGRFIGLGASFMATERLMVSVEALRHNFEDAPVQVDDEAEDFDYVTVLDTFTLRGSFRF